MNNIFRTDHPGHGQGHGKSKMTMAPQAITHSSNGGHHLIATSGIGMTRAMRLTTQQELVVSVLVEIMGCANLATSQLTKVPLANPYVKVKLAKPSNLKGRIRRQQALQIHKTKTIHQTNNPHFTLNTNSTFLIDGMPVEELYLAFGLLFKVKHKKQELGYFHLPVHVLLQASGEPMLFRWIHPLQMSSGIAGTITLRCRPTQPNDITFYKPRKRGYFREYLEAPRQLDDRDRMLLGVMPPKKEQAPPVYIDVVTDDEGASTSSNYQENEDDDNDDDFDDRSDHKIKAKKVPSWKVSSFFSPSKKKLGKRQSSEGDVPTRVMTKPKASRKPLPVVTIAVSTDTTAMESYASSPPMSPRSVSDPSLPVQSSSSSIRKSRKSSLFGGRSSKQNRKTMNSQGQVASASVSFPGPTPLNIRPEQRATIAATQLKEEQVQEWLRRGTALPTCQGGEEDWYSRSAKLAIGKRPLDPYPAREEEEEYVELDVHKPRNNNSLCQEKCCFASAPANTCLIL